ncbi:hypothetical protein GE09DRAFT_1222079 [Coniochaeta sp. 2T2.1]|nr:hypothetical protein GE09DRAFT_1222079 [Coniochaeta sp. 2T2.1]
MPVPDFTSLATFPTFSTLPSASSSSSDDDTQPPSSSSSSATQYFLLAQIKENMTITRPTLICTDLSGQDFALMFIGSIDFAARGLKKGCTVVVPNARRTESAKKEGGQGWVVVEEGDFGGVRSLPGGGGDVVRLLGRRREEEDGDRKRCSWCGKEEGEGRLMKCSRCGEVRYCSKECQAIAWKDGHKGDCKLMKAMREVWP